jgi:PAS domain S-box-containing protein
MVGGDELSSLADAVNEMLAALERFQNDLREGEERYRLLFNSGNDAVFVSELMSDGMPGRLIEVNDVACQKTGYTREELLSLSAFDIVAPEDTSGFPALAEQFLVDESVLLEATGVGKDGKIIPVEVSVHLFDLSGKPAVLAIARDITERKQAEENLAAIYALGRELVLSRNRQRVAQTTVDAARLLLRCRLCGLWLVDEVERKLVCQAYTAGGQTVQKDALSLDGERGVIAAVARSGNPIYVPDERMDQRFIDAGLGTRSELCVPLRAGERIIGAINAESEKPDAFGEVEQRLLFMTLADQAALAIENAELYEQMRAGRDRLRTLSRRLVEVQETERRQIARELHDEIGQMLTGLKLVLEMSMRLPADTALSGMSEAQTLVNELLGRVRELSLDLRPAMLDDLGLLPSLLWHFERYTAQTDVQVVFKHTGLEGQHFASEVETAAYRIVQEALTNVARHADVSEAAVRVWADGETLGVQIEDQGAGFDPEDALAAGDSSGLSGMQERAVLLGGLLTIESNPGAGTTLTVELPLGASGEEEGARCA